MERRYTHMLKELRGEVLDRLLEVRASVDPAYGGVAPEVLRPQFAMVMDKIESFLATQDMASYRRFAERWLAMGIASGFSPETINHTVAAIVDVIDQVVSHRLARNPATCDFRRALAHAGYVAAGLLTECLAVELEQRRARVARLSRDA